jgi:hypothetical protein
VAHRSDLHRIVLDACRRAGVELLMAALSSGWVPGRARTAPAERWMRAKRGWPLTGYLDAATGRSWTTTDLRRYVAYRGRSQ